ncbi:MAG: PAS domain S-box protein [Phenylobacterium sp.]|uniref:two-component system sensor histidine kinase NtrB n=1 Tax=Phenylobacterium sp. TaxID=1871053 RepID=UPI001A3648E0|nr:PAS domain-containing sensor histidine kinase [Phenylobacterium sp.]MBL8556379.1 PAS domain S-box protein [Phenylobacterium sp.]
MAKNSTLSFRILGGQVLAVGLSAVVLAVVYAAGPLFGHSVYVLGAPALFACAWMGGPLGALTATILMTLGGVWLDGLADIPPIERVLRGLLFLGMGAAAGAAAARIFTQRRAAAELIADQAEREALLQASLEIVADALAVIDDRGVIQSVSRAAERIFGWSAAELVGQDLSRLMPPGEDAALAGDGNGDDVSGSTRQLTGLRRDGETFPMEVRIGHVDIESGRLLTVVVRDLTSMQEAERRNDELRSQLSQVWSANSMGEMAQVLAHELNQPLSAVTNYLRAARNLIARLELNEDDLIDAVARAGDQAVRAGEIIRTMRDLATRGGTLQKPESLSAIIGEVDFIIALMARDANVRVVYDLYKGQDTVMADRIQIQQLVVNLARNAIEAVTKYPTRQLQISTKLDSEDRILTTVEDSGPGIDPSVSDRLFQPLASTKPEGMGLGLSISNAIVENHRGRIWAEPSRLGGAAFCFVLARAGADGDVSGRADGVRRR